jgi:tetratricopeptide (TPR) repeat protein
VINIFFSSILKECGKDAALTQEAVGRMIYKTPGFVSRLESGGVQVKVPPIHDKKIIIDLFRQKGVADAKLKTLETAWDEILRLDGSNKITEEPIIQLVLKTLDELQDFDHKAFINDLEQLILMWREYYFTMTDFHDDKLSFSSAEQQYSILLDQKGRELAIYLDPRIHLERARQRRYLAKNDEANIDLNLALETVNKIDDPKLKLEILIEFGDFYRRSDDLTKSLNYYKDADRLCSNYKYNNAIPKVRIASCYLVAGDPMHAFSYCEDAVRIARSTRDAHLERKATENIAWAKSMFGYFDEALNLQLNSYMDAIESHLQLKDLAKSSCYLAGFDLICGKYKDAEKHYLESLSYIKRLDDMIIHRGVVEKEIFIKSWVLLGLTSTYLHIPGNQRAVDEYLLESREIGEKLNDVLTIGRSDELRGRLNIKKGDFNAARAFFQSARVRYSKAGMATIGDKTRCNPYYLTRLELCCTELEFLLGNNVDALKHVVAAETIADQYKLTGYIIMARLWKARILLAEPNPDVELSLELVRDSIKVSMAYGISHLHSILETVDEFLLDIYKKNAGFAVQLTGSMILWKESLYTLKPNSGLTEDIDRWFKELIDLRGDWKSMQDAENMTQKGPEESGNKK